MTVEYALAEKDSMNTSHDKKLFITLFGYLVNDSFKKRLQNGESVDNLFNELCLELEKKSSY